MPNDSIPKLNATRAKQLIDLAYERFSDDLSNAEEKVLSDSANSEFPDFSGESCEEPLVRSKFLRWVVSDIEAHKYIDPRGVRVYGAIIADELNVGDCLIPFPLDFRCCEFRETLSLVASEARQISLLQCRLNKGISADRLTLNGSLIMRGLDLFGTIRLNGAMIKKHFECSGSRILTSGNAISLEGATVEGDVLLKPFPSGHPTRRFISTGSIRMNGVTIKGDLNCAGAIICLQAVNTEGSGFYLDRAVISGSVHFGTGFRANREVRAVDASIGRSLECPGAHLARDGYALNLNRTRIGGSVLCDDGFCCQGTIRMDNAQIASDLSFFRASVGSVSCEGMKLNGDLIWASVSDSGKAGKYLNVAGASVKNIRDDNCSWPKSGKLVVAGLEYKGLIDHDPASEEHFSKRALAQHRRLKVRQRIQWLCLQEKVDRLDPQAWVWLAKLLKEKDHEYKARWVLLNYRLRQAIAGNWLLFPFRLPLVLLSWEPLLVLLPFLLILYLGSQTYQRAWNEQAIHPTAVGIFFQKPGNAPAHSNAVTNQIAIDACSQEPASTEFLANCEYARAYPVFNPWVYTLENELPLVRFGMDDKWAPDPNLIANGQGWTYWYLTGWRWGLILAGWAQGILLTIGINRRFRD